jgi:membrane protease YdiL (CAAX protease family)
MAGTASLKKEDVVLWRLWHYLPVLIRAPLAGLAVAFGGIQVWRYLVAANLAVSPSAPWSVPAMALYLWLYWCYLNGRGWPQATAGARQRDLRARPLSPSMWRWSLLAGGSFMAAAAPLTLLLERFFPISRTLPDFLRRFPTPTLLWVLLMSSLVAGLVEEAAFRGYLQAPIERRHGPVFAILLTTAVFVLVHLPGRSHVSPAYLLLVALASLNYGVLAHLTQSILPGLVLHASGNAAAFAVLLWFEVTIGPRDWQRVPLAQALREPLFLTNCLELVVLMALSLWAFRKLAMQSTRPAVFGAHNSGHASEIMR